MKFIINNLKRLTKKEEFKEKSKIIKKSLENHNLTPKISKNKYK